MLSEAAMIEILRVSSRTAVGLHIREANPGNTGGHGWPNPRPASDRQVGSPEFIIQPQRVRVYFDPRSLSRAGVDYDRSY